MTRIAKIYLVMKNLSTQEVNLYLDDLDIMAEK